MVLFLLGSALLPSWEELSQLTLQLGLRSQAPDFVLGNISASPRPSGK